MESFFFCLLPGLLLFYFLLEREFDPFSFCPMRLVFLSSLL